MKIIKLVNVHKNVTHYRIQFPSGKLMTATFKTEKQAKRFLEKVLKDAKELLNEMAKGN